MCCIFICSPYMDNSAVSGFYVFHIQANDHGVWSITSTKKNKIILDDLATLIHLRLLKRVFTMTCCVTTYLLNVSKQMFMMSKKGQPEYMHSVKKSTIPLWNDLYKTCVSVYCFLWCSTSLRSLTFNGWTV